MHSLLYFSWNMQNIEQNKKGDKVMMMTVVKTRSLEFFSSSSSHSHMLLPGVILCDADGFGNDVDTITIPASTSTKPLLLLVDKVKRKIYTHTCAYPTWVFSNNSFGCWLCWRGIFKLRKNMLNPKDKSFPKADSTIWLFERESAGLIWSGLSLW